MLVAPSDALAMSFDGIGWDQGLGRCTVSMLNVQTLPSGSDLCDAPRLFDGAALYLSYATSMLFLCASPISFSPLCVAPLANPLEWWPSQLPGWWLYQ